jgi:WD40 repeat protein
MLLSASRDRTARLFNVATGELEGTYSGHGAPLLAAVFVDDRSVVSLARGRSLHVWDLEKREKRGDFTELTGEMNQIASSPLGVLSAGADHRVRVHQPGDRREIFALFGHDDVVQALAVAPSGETFASGSADGTVCIWSLACGTWVQRFVASPRAP